MPMPYIFCSQLTGVQHCHLRTDHCLGWWSPGQGQNAHYEHPQDTHFHLTNHCLGWWSPDKIHIMSVHSIYIHLHLTNHCLGWWSPGQNTRYEHLHLKNHCLGWLSPGQGQNTHYEHPQYIPFHLTNHCLGWWSPRQGKCIPWVSTNYTAMPSSLHKPLSMQTEPSNLLGKIFCFFRPT